MLRNIRFYPTFPHRDLHKSNLRLWHPHEYLIKPYKLLLMHEPGGTLGHTCILTHSFIQTLSCNLIYACNLSIVHSLYFLRAVPPPNSLLSRSTCSRKFFFLLLSAVQSGPQLHYLILVPFVATSCWPATETAWGTTQAHRVGQLRHNTLTYWVLS